ncbi:MFS transporter [Sphingomonas oryzagri]|uniref:MFS transporter n=1 Tax=Sphingomonas oryzagri TaxID=3042314 RepID=A0ABT6N1B9_9SPHN|nr:MFS transporter [Sphingomonas oryzagri]MDH7639091.1 MFS transporter [Sphingomonas oryzagri]
MVLATTGAAPDEAAARFETDIAAATSETRRTNWGGVVLLAVILFIAGGVRLLMTPLQEAAQHDIGFTDLQIATLQGSANGLPAFLSAIPLGLAIDHWNRSRTLLLMGLFWTAGAFMTAYAHDFTTLFIARALVALGVGGAFGVAMSMIADLCIPAKRGRATMVAGIGVLAGPALAFAGGGALFGYFKLHGWSLFPDLAPWRQAALVFAMLGTAMLAPILLFPEPKRHEVEHSAGVMLALRGIAKRWKFLTALWIGATAGGMAEGAAGMWAAPILTRYYGLQPNEFGGWMGGTIFLAGLIGSIIGGFSVDLGNKSGRRGGLMIGSIIAMVIAIPATAYPIMPTVPGFGFMLGLMMACCTVMQVTAMAAVTLVVPNEERGMCLQITGMVGVVVGMAFVPVITLLGPAIFGDERHLPQTLVIIGVVSGVIGVAGNVVAMLFVPRSWKDA